DPPIHVTIPSPVYFIFARRNPIQLPQKADLHGVPLHGPAGRWNTKEPDGYVPKVFRKHGHFSPKGTRIVRELCPGATQAALPESKPGILFAGDRGCILLQEV